MRVSLQICTLLLCIAVLYYDSLVDGQRRTSRTVRTPSRTVRTVRPIVRTTKASRTVRPIVRTTKASRTVRPIVRTTPLHNLIARTTPKRKPAAKTTPKRKPGAKTTPKRKKGGKTKPKKKSGSKRAKIKTVSWALDKGFPVYGMLRYRSRFYNTDYWTEDPNVCSSLPQNLYYGNTNQTSNETTMYITTTSKTRLLKTTPRKTATSKPTSLVYFVCPFNEEDSHDSVYCCGEETGQKCCTLMESGQKVPLIVGVVVGLLVFLIAAALVAFFIFKRYKKSMKKNKKESSKSKEAEEPNALLEKHGAPDHHS